MLRLITTQSFNFGKSIGGTGIGLVFLVLVGVLPSMPASSAISSNAESTKAIPRSAPAKGASQSEIERARQYFTDTEMTTQKGEKVRFYSDVLQDRIVLINVMYTNCKGACPLITQKLSQVSRELGDLFGKDIHFVSVTNDAERDTPEALSEFAENQGVNQDGWTFLTGPKQQVDKVINKIGLYTPKFEQHKAIILIGNTRTGHWQKLKPGLPYKAMSQKLKELASEG